MPISVVQTQKATGNNTVFNLAFSSNVTIGNQISVFIRVSNASGAPSSVADNLGHTYVLDASSAVLDPYVFAYSTTVTTGGACTVTVTWGVSASFVSVYSVESTGYSAAPSLDESDSNTGGAATDLVSNSLSTTVAETILFVFASQNGFATYTAGTDFTLLDGNIGSIGGAQYRVTSSPLSAYAAHITSSISAQYAMVAVAYRGGAAGPGAPTFNALMIMP